MSLTLTDSKYPGAVRMETAGAALTMTKLELQAIVQQAYDHYGILAQPSLVAEADRGPGRCPCGMAGCSDAGTDPVQTWRDAVDAAHNTGARA